MQPTKTAAQMFDLVTRTPTLLHSRLTVGVVSAAVADVRALLLAGAGQG